MTVAMPPLSEPYERNANCGTTTMFSARVRQITYLAEDILSFELVPIDGNLLPAWTPGAHIDVVTPTGPRQYSLTLGSNRQRYIVAVLDEAVGRGGSRAMHREVHAGDILEISRPRNNFPLTDNGGPTLLIGGGIGLTPLLSMAEHLSRTVRDWRLVYCARDRAHAAFLDDLDQFSEHVSLHLDEDIGAPDIAEIVDSGRQDADLYCCGPAAMIDAFLAATEGINSERIHIERFRPSAEVALDAGEFVVELARSNQCFKVPPEKTILEVLLDNGIEANCSCCVGVCGTCETAVLDGQPDHRDSVLTDAEKAAGDTMFICCSRAAGDRLVLDL